MQKFEQFFASTQARCNTQLARLIEQQSLPNRKLNDAISYSLLSGGKRVRPILCCAAAATVGEINECSEYFACAVEAIHCYSLIHDDLPAMDDDDLRRGQPTSHKVYGEAMAILAGDALQAMAFEWLVLAPGASAELRLEATRILAKSAGARGMVAGQALDIAAMNTNPGVEDLELMHSQKTGALIQASLSLGALSAHANTDDLRAIQQYGSAMGLAFQVQDDILDVEMDTETLGKKQGADAEHNKPTYVSLLGLQGAREKANSLYLQAMDALSHFGDKAHYLHGLAEYIVKRNH